MDPKQNLLKGPVLLTGVFLALAFLVFYAFKDIGISEPLVLLVIVIPILSVFALVLLLIWLALILGTNDLAFHPHAFGLPAGSIRAILALSLVAIFVAAAFFLAGSKDLMAPVAAVVVEEVELPKGFQVNPEARKAFEDRLPAGTTFLRSTHTKDDATTERIDIISITSSQARIDLIKQVFTVVATALVTVIGFYFGSKTATQGQPGDASSPLSADDRSTLAATAAANADKAGGVLKEIEKAVDKASRSKRSATQAVSASSPRGDKKYPLLKKNLEVATKAAGNTSQALADAKLLVEKIQTLSEKIKSKAEPAFDATAATREIGEMFAKLERLRTVAQAAASKAARVAALSAASTAKETR